MEIKLKNIGPFRESKIILKDVTIIAGQNDTGKSYVNKVIYSIFKTNSINFKSEILETFVRYASMFIHIFEENNTNFNTFFKKKIMDLQIYLSSDVKDLFLGSEKIYKDIEIFNKKWKEILNLQNNYVMDLLDKIPDFMEELNSKIAEYKKMLNLINIIYKRIEDTSKQEMKSILYFSRYFNRVLDLIDEYEKNKIFKELDNLIKYNLTNNENIFSKYFSAILFKTFANESIKNKKYSNNTWSINIAEDNEKFNINYQVKRP